MGMFDSLFIPCPKCGKKIEFQSKAASCSMDVWTSFDEAPTAVLVDVMNGPEYHAACGSWVVLIDPRFPPGWRPTLRAELVKAPFNPEEHPQGFKWWPDDRAFSFSDLEAGPPQAREGADNA